MLWLNFFFTIMYLNNVFHVSNEANLQIIVNHSQFLQLCAKMYSVTHLKWELSSLSILTVYNSHISGQIYKDSLSCSLGPWGMIRLN
jgi:hypothetical protein